MRQSQNEIEIKKRKKRRKNNKKKKRKVNPFHLRVVGNVRVYDKF